MLIICFCEDNCLNDDKVVPVDLRVGDLLLLFHFLLLLFLLLLELGPLSPFPSAVEDVVFIIDILLQLLDSSPLSDFPFWICP